MAYIRFYTIILLLRTLLYNTCLVLDSTLISKHPAITLGTLTSKVPCLITLSTLIPPESEPSKMTVHTTHYCCAVALAINSNSPCWAFVTVIKPCASVASKKMSQPSQPNPPPPQKKAAVIRRWCVCILFIALSGEISDRRVGHEKIEHVRLEMSPCFLGAPTEKRRKKFTARTTHLQSPDPHTVQMMYRTPSATLGGTFGIISKTVICC